MAKRPIVCRKLKGLMAEHEITVRELAKKIGISENSLTLKINGHRDWWYWEMVSVMKCFGFSEVKEVFPEIYNSVLNSKAI